jgi:hypothetical protein
MLRILGGEGTVFKKWCLKTIFASDNIFESDPSPYIKSMQKDYILKGETRNCKKAIRKWGKKILHLGIYRQ